MRLALENPAEKGELRVFNQFTETFSVNELAERVRRVGEEMGLSVEVQTLPNPRKEAEEHYYNPAHTGLIELGLEPNYLTDAVLGEMMETVVRHRAGINKGAIFRGVKW